MVSSLFQIFIGFTGLVGFLLRFIGPLTVAPTIALVGLSLFDVCSSYAGKCINASPDFKSFSRIKDFETALRHSGESVYVNTISYENNLILFLICYVFLGTHWGITVL